MVRAVDESKIELTAARAQHWPYHPLPRDLALVSTPRPNLPLLPLQSEGSTLLAVVMYQSQSVIHHCVIHIRWGADLPSALPWTINLSLQTDMWNFRDKHKHSHSNCLYYENGSRTVGNCVGNCGYTLQLSARQEAYLQVKLLSSVARWADFSNLST